MTLKIGILICMIFMHLLEDFHLQGCLANLKQKTFWAKQINEITSLGESRNEAIKKYKYDYLISLIAHATEWTFMMMLPMVAFAIYKGFYGISLIPFVATLIQFFANIVYHAFVDNLKANKMKINLVQDQLLHLLQIVLTWLAIAFS